MEKKNINASSKKKNITQRINKKQRNLTLKKEKGFGGPPDFDPKKFLGCG
jgi:hypothetical protein